MRTVPGSVSLLAMIVALGLSACSSDTGGAPTPAASSGGHDVTAACSVAGPDPATSVPSTTGQGAVRGSVGVVLPRVRDQVRPYGADDARVVTRALERRGLTVEVAAPEGRAAFVTSARRMIDRGVSVLVVSAIDHSSGVEVERAAARAGVDVIDYGRLTTGGSARYLVSFDAEAIGRMQAQTLVACLAQQGVTDPRIIVLDGGTDVDDAAVLMDRGVHEVLDPLVAAGHATIEEEAAVKGWHAVRAEPTFQLALDAAGGQVDGVLAASDGIADSVIGVLAREGRNGAVAVAGQGSGIQGLRHMVTGQQSLTVFDDPRAEADAAARLAAALVAGRSPSSAGLRLRRYADPRSPDRSVEAVLLPGQVVTRANLQDVVRAGGVSVDALCAGITEPCAALGLS